MYCSDLDPVTRAELQEQAPDLAHFLHQLQPPHRPRLSRALHWLERRLTTPGRQRVTE